VTAFRPLRPYLWFLVPAYEYVLREARRLDPGLKTCRDVAGRERVDHRQFRTDPRLAVILALGASNIANEGDPNGLFVPEHGVFNFNFFDGRCYAARDPLLGATLERSNPLTRLADLLVRRGIYDRVLLVPIAHGGTYAAEWSPAGRMHPRLRRALKMLRRRKIAVTHALWQEGEAEAGTPGSDPKAWVTHVQAVAGTIRAATPESAFYVAQCTVCRNAPNELIRAAQRAAADPARRIFAGPDLDVIGIEDRWDQCHFSVRGLERAAELWFAALTRAKPWIR
jgi:hypothetical protein